MGRWGEHQRLERWEGRELGVWSLRRQLRSSWDWVIPSSRTIGEGHGGEGGTRKFRMLGQSSSQSVWCELRAGGEGSWDLDVSDIVIWTWLVCVTGRGGFSLARPCPYTRPGGYVLRNPRPAPVRGPRALIHWTGPRLLPPIFNRDPSGVWVGRQHERGQGQGMPKKKPRPRLLSGAGLGKGLAACVFRGPVCPGTNFRYGSSRSTGRRSSNL